MASALGHHRVQAGRAIVTYLAMSVMLATSGTAQVASSIDCSTATSTPELNWCAEQELAKADKELNRAYQRSLRQIAATDTVTATQRDQWTASLREAQRRWIAFRDQDCGEVVGYEWSGGTGRTGAELGCRLTKTQARTRELEERYQGN